MEKPVVKNGQIVVGNTMMLSLACDHRTIDGATGAQFLQTLKQYIENPVTMLALVFQYLFIKKVPLLLRDFLFILLINPLGHVFTTLKRLVL